MHAAGGVDAFLEDHALIVMSDHSQTKVEDRVNLAEAFSSWRVLTPSDPAPTEAEIALCPAARSAQLYVLDESRRDELVPRAVDTLLELEGVDLVATREGDGVDGALRSGTALVPARRRPHRSAGRGAGRSRAITPRCCWPWARGR